MTRINCSHFYATLANPVFAEPLRCLHQKDPFDQGRAHEFGMARAGVALSVGTDALVTAVVRQVTTGPLAAWRVTALAWDQPGIRKTGVVAALAIGLAGGALLGAGGGVADLLQAGWYLGAVTPANVLVATTRRAFKAVEQTVDDMWKQVDLFAAGPVQATAPAAAPVAVPAPAEVAPPSNEVAA